jgi:hypothetical protein
MEAGGSSDAICRPAHVKLPSEVSEIRLGLVQGRNLRHEPEVLDPAAAASKGALFLKSGTREGAIAAEPLPRAACTADRTVTISHDSESRHSQEASFSAWRGGSWPHIGAAESNGGLRSG